MYFKVRSITPAAVEDKYKPVNPYPAQGKNDPTCNQILMENDTFNAMLTEINSVLISTSLTLNFKTNINDTKQKVEKSIGMYVEISELLNQCSMLIIAINTNCRVLIGIDRH